MSFVRILVDGYSMLHACREERPKAPPHSPMARDWLIRTLTLYQDAVHTPVTIVFDGMGSKASRESQEIYPHLEVIYSKGNRTADDIIERVTHRLLEYGNVLVVTNDYAEQNTIFSMGGSVSSCEQFFEDIRTELDRFQSDLKQRNRRSRKGSV